MELQSKIRIKDIAERAGVSVGTVDRVIHGRTNVSKASYDKVQKVLDEINYAVKFGLLDVQEVLALLQEKPSQLHLVLTGRDARSEIVEAADLVTEMHLVKHPFKKGIKAQKGIEF